MEVFLRVRLEDGCTRHDLARIIMLQARRIDRAGNSNDHLEEGDGGPIRDADGRTLIGRWEVVFPDDAELG